MSHYPIEYFLADAVIFLAACIIIFYTGAFIYWAIVKIYDKIFLARFHSRFGKFDEDEKYR